MILHGSDGSLVVIQKVLQEEILFQALEHGLCQPLFFVVLSDHIGLQFKVTGDELEDLF